MSMNCRELIDTLEDVAWEKTVESVQSMGQIILTPEKFNECTTFNILGTTINTVSWINSIRQKGIDVDDVMDIALEFIKFFQDSITGKKFEDARVLIATTELDRVIRSFNYGIILEDVIPIFKDFLRSFGK